MRKIGFFLNFREEKRTEKDDEVSFNDANFWKLSLQYDEDELIKELLLPYKERRMSNEKK